MAGIACASELQRQNFPVTVFEKSRGIGGRLATRRTPEGYSFDHGAPFFTAESEAFSLFCLARIRAGNIAVWASPESEMDQPSGWMVGAPGMNSFLKDAATPLDVTLQSTVSSLKKTPDGWEISFADSPARLTFEAVVVTAPAPQAQKLTETSARLSEAIGKAVMAPCWALMIALEETDLSSFTVLTDPHPDISFIGRNSSKPLRNQTPETLVIHASGDYNSAHLEDTPEAVIQALMPIVLDITGRKPGHVLHAAAHRWRYANVLRPAGAPFLADETGTLLAAGDWCIGPGAEAAFLSGMAAAQHLISQHTQNGL